MKIRYLLFVSLLLLVGCKSPDWRTASREPAGIAASPETFNDAVIEFYAADAFSWRGWFAVHTWIAIKPVNAAEYTVFEILGWRVNSGRPALVSYTTKTPDRYWYGARPERILHITGKDAEQIIPKMLNAIDNYPYANEYVLFPGPNSNTFPAWLGIQVPELELELPFNALGSGYAD